MRGWLRRKIEAKQEQWREDEARRKAYREELQEIKKEQFKDLMRQRLRENARMEARKDIDRIMPLRKPPLSTGEKFKRIGKGLEGGLVGIGAGMEGAMGSIFGSPPPRRYPSKRKTKKKKKRSRARTYRPHPDDFFSWF